MVFQCTKINDKAAVEDFVFQGAEINDKVAVEDLAFLRGEINDKVAVEDLVPILCSLEVWSLNKPVHNFDVNLIHATIAYRL